MGGLISVLRGFGNAVPIVSTLDMHRFKIKAQVVLLEDLNRMHNSDYISLHV